MDFDNKSKQDALDEAMTRACHPQMSREMWEWLHLGNSPVRPMPVTRLDLSLVASDIIDDILKKNADYGDAWQALGEAGAAARFVDKFFRIEKLANGHEALVIDEKISDTIGDLIGYGLLILLYKKFHGIPYDPKEVFKFSGA